MPPTRRWQRLWLTLLLGAARKGLLLCLCDVSAGFVGGCVDPCPNGFANVDGRCVEQAAEANRPADMQPNQPMQPVDPTDKVDDGAAPTQLPPFIDAGQVVSDPSDADAGKRIKQRADASGSQDTMPGGAAQSTQAAPPADGPCPVGTIRCDASATVVEGCQSDATWHIQRACLLVEYGYS